MITEYFRPQSLEEALSLLTRPDTRILAGGTKLTHLTKDTFAVIDIQALGLDKITISGNHFEIGAAANLQSLVEFPQIPATLKSALKLEAPLNLRNMGTIAGTILSSDGRSAFIACLLALDAKLTEQNGDSSKIRLGNFLLSRSEQPHKKLITQIEIPLKVKLAFETVGRTPDDKPIVCAALTKWPSGRTRLVIGGWGASPSLAMDGMEASGIEEAACNAAHDASDQWASAEYRIAIAAVLAKRCLVSVE